MAVKFERGVLHGLNNVVVTAAPVQRMGVANDHCGANLWGICA
jgi:hypothetical protein